MVEPGQYCCVRMAMALAVAISGACGGSAPAAPEIHHGSLSGRTLQGQTVSAADSVILGGVSVRLGALVPTTSDQNGNFTLDTELVGASAIELTGPSIVPRQTAVRLPADRLVTFPLIPSGFDMSAFDEMFRGSHARLQRWTAVPSLVVLASVMRFESSEASVVEATAEQFTAGDVEALVRDLTQALAVLTGETYVAFARVTVERPAAGSRASINRAGEIVVARYRDLEARAKVIGYGRCAERDDGAITAGSIVLDAAFDRTHEQRRLLRTHELGHALGYKHVTTRPSIMNPSLGFDVTDFDRQGAAIAFQRPPGNRAPDTDPAPAVRAATTSIVRWSPPIE